MDSGELKWRLLGMARETIGVYPHSVQGGDKPYKERTDYMNGWNAAGMAILKAYFAIEKLVESQPKNITQQLCELTDDSVIFWSYDEVAYDAGERPEPTLCILCSDTFAYACADAEDLAIEDVEQVYDIYKRFGHEGITAWVALKRQQEPMNRYITDKYKEAKNFLICAKPVENS